MLEGVHSHYCVVTHVWVYLNIQLYTVNMEYACPNSAHL